MNTQLKTPLLRGNGFGREVVNLKRIAFKVPTERASKIRSPLRVEFSTGYSTEYSTCIQLVFNWQLSFQLASAKGSCSGLACRPTSRPREAPCREAAPPATSHGPVGCWGRARLAGRQRIKPNALRCRNARRRMQWSRQDKSSHMLSKAPNIAHKCNVSYFWDALKIRPAAFVLRNHKSQTNCAAPQSSRLS